jgi:hypothetical protein
MQECIQNKKPKRREKSLEDSGTNLPKNKKKFNK